MGCNILKIQKLIKLSAICINEPLTKIKLLHPVLQVVCWCKVVILDDAFDNAYIVLYNKVTDLCRSSVVIYGCMDQPYKETNFSKQQAIEIYYIYKKG